MSSLCWKFYPLDLLRNIFSKFHLKPLGERLSFYILLLLVYWPDNICSIEAEFSRYFPPRYKSDHNCLSTDPRIPVFVYWDSGFDNAPDVVQVCISSLKTVLSPSSYKLIELNSSNIDEYLPRSPLIDSFYNRSYLQKSHHSDLIRSLLLFYYGGIWIDSTMFFVSPIPSNIAASPLFLFRTTSSWKPFSNQFIVASKGDHLNKKVFKLLIVYLIRCLRRFPFPLSYSFYHYLLAITVRKLSVPVYPLYSGLNTHCLQHSALGLVSSRSALYTLFRQSFVHKLTYKKMLFTSNNIDILSALLDFVSFNPL